MRASALHLMTVILLMAPVVGAGSARAERPGAADATAPSWSESGEASWYGPRHEGMRTTSGEAFDGNKMTAAHSSLPLGSYVRVTLQRSGRSIIVRVNDREPPHGVRCIDLSRAAANRLGIVSQGVADVTLAQASPEEAEELAEAPDVTATKVHAVRAFSARRGPRRMHRGRR